MCGACETVSISDDSFSFFLTTTATLEITPKWTSGEETCEVEGAAPALSPWESEDTRWLGVEENCGSRRQDIEYVISTWCTYTFQELRRAEQHLSAFFCKARFQQVFVSLVRTCGTFNLRSSYPSYINYVHYTSARRLLRSSMIRSLALKPLIFIITTSVFGLTVWSAPRYYGEFWSFITNIGKWAFLAGLLCEAIQPCLLWLWDYYWHDTTVDASKDSSTDIAICLRHSSRCQERISDTSKPYRSDIRH